MAQTARAGAADYRRTLANEWPTLAVALAIHAGWVALTWFWAALPLWVVLPAGAWLVAWHNSLQHEAIHHHPTPWPLLNTAIAALPLGLWLPFPLYRMSHLEHHRRPELLTSPLDDPESYYLLPARWQRMGRPARLVSLANQTLLGRLLLGPAIVVGRFLAEEAVLLWRGRPGRRRIWLLHALGVAAMLGWLAGVCGMPIPLYLLGIVYPALSLSLLRSFAEHRADPDPERRTAVVEAGPLLALLFLNNNLHLAHHLRPGVAWHRLPALAAELGVAKAAGDAHYRGYATIVRRFLLRPVAHPVHPLTPPAA